jgi:hypothetical protein
MLTATGVNSPKHFPKSVEDMLEKSKPLWARKPMSKDQWEAAIKALTGGAPPGKRKDRP